MKKRKRSIAIFFSVWLLLGSLFGEFSGNVLTVQASENQSFDANGEEVVRIIIRDEADLNTWLWYKETDAGQRIAQTITRIEISNVTSIPDYAFADLAKLNTVVFDMLELPALGKQVFYGTNTRTVHFWVPYEKRNECYDALRETDESGVNKLGYSPFYVDDILLYTPTTASVEISLQEVGNSQQGGSLAEQGQNNIHTHTWILKEYIAATATEDAVVAPICEGCGIGGSYTKRPGSAHTRFLLDIVEQINEAEQDAEVIASTELWVSMNYLVTEALAERADVSLTINYKYKGKYYALTIPAGYDVKTLTDENGWVGFRHIDSVLPGRELTKEEWKNLKK